ncbi:uncharacterized protein LOC131957010 [Physella acuta]|uniref:uncharacterized protein LOC131957010 n=1 Tax=Physella acuta TaxID=109671 RepID=UPI0027DC2E87|nr:uncharacterized protein LOC131957010 [Physella acuta]
MSEVRSTTVISQLEVKVSKCPQQEALVFYDVDLHRCSLTYLELYTLSARFSKLLRDAGLQRGEYVLSTLDVCPEAAVATMGVLMAGGVNVAVEVFMASGDTFYDVVQRTKARYIIASTSDQDLNWKLIESNFSSSGDDLIAHVKKNATNLNFLEKAFIVRRSDNTSSNPGFLQHLKSRSQAYVDPDVGPGDLCMVFCTASAHSLVCMVGHTHGGIIQGAESFRDNLNGARNFLYPSPNSWVSSTPGDFLVWGTTRVSLDRWRPSTARTQHELLADVIQRETIEMAWLVPADAQAVLAHWLPRPLPMVPHLITGAMPISRAAILPLMPACSLLTIRYLASETQGVSFNSLRHEGDFPDFDTGVLEPGVEIQVIDEDGTVLGSGQQGRLALRTPGMFRQYVGQPEQDTEDRFTPDGWFLSSDAGYLREDGHLFVSGRNDDMILHNIFNIHPSWIEKDIRTHQDVEKVVVVPIPDKVNYHNICACVVRKPGSDVTKEEIQSHFRSQYVADEQDTFCPTEVLFLESFPEASPGRVDRRGLARLAQETLGTARLAEYAVGVVKLLVNGRFDSSVKDDQDM